MKSRLVVLAMTFCLCTVAFTGKTMAQTRYCVAYGILLDSSGDKSGVRFISNVFEIRCNATEGDVTVQMNEWVKSEKRRLGYDSINRSSFFQYRFDSRDAAERKRREIRSEREEDDTYVFRDREFSYLCD